MRDKTILFQNKKLIMMKQILIICLQLAVAAGLLTGCHKDLGNYDYHAINDVTINTTSDTFRVLMYDTLKIAPSISASDISRIKYEWRVHPVADPAEPLGMGKIVVISRDRDLKEQISLKAQESYYQLDLVATDTITGVSYFKNFRLQVRTAFQTGWMLLEHKTNNADISFIGPDNKVYHNIYSASNADNPLPLTARQLISVNTQGLLGMINMVCLDNGGPVLDNTTLAATADYSKLFYSPPAINQPRGMRKPSLLSSGPYTFSGDKVYSMNAMFTSILFGAAFTEPDSKGYGVAPFAGSSNTYGGIFFDQLNHRFLYDGGSTSTTLKAFPATASMPFDLSNVQKNMLTMKPGMGWDLWPDSWYAVFKNKTDDNCFLYTINANGNLTDNNPVASGYQPISNSPDVSKSPDYLFSSTVRQMYYAAGNKLYVYDMAANQSRVIYTFANGENVTTLQIQTDNLIVLATYNGTPEGGSVYYLPLSSTGDISGNTYSQKFTGFEKIVHLVFKVG